MDSSMLSNFAIDSNKSNNSRLNTSSSSGVFNDGGSNIMKFWQPSSSNSYLQTPNLMSTSGYDIQRKPSQIQNELTTNQLQSSGISSEGGISSRNVLSNSQNIPNSKLNFAPNGKNTSSLNINAPSYVPNVNHRQIDSNATCGRNKNFNLIPGRQEDLFTQSTATKGPSSFHNYTSNSNENTAVLSSTSELYDRSSLTNFSFSQRNFGDNSISELEAPSEDTRKLKLEIVMKNQMIKSLTDQISVVNDIRSNSLKNLELSVSPDTQSMSVPSNYYQLFKDLSKVLHEKTQELNDTKQRLEAILVSLTVNPTSNNSFTASGAYDPQELAHKIVTKLATLQNENENLLKMVSLSNKASLLIELGLLKNENKTLKDKLSKASNSG